MSSRTLVLKKEKRLKQILRKVKTFIFHNHFEALVRNSDAILVYRGTCFENHCLMCSMRNFWSDRDK